MVRSRKRILRKPFLRRIYEEWYDTIAAHLPDIEGPVLELGCGGGFLKERIDRYLATDIVKTPWIACAADGTALPFKSNRFRAIILVNVLHHLHDPYKFFTEAQRCLRQSGSILFIEPWVSGWSRFIFSTFHHEPFDPGVKKWRYDPVGPLSGVNNALPWIIFSRDRSHFESQFPALRLERIEPFMPFRYLVSGGLRPFVLAPASSNNLWKAIERRFSGSMNSWAMFAFIEIVKTG